MHTDETKPATKQIFLVNWRLVVKKTFRLDPPLSDLICVQFAFDLKLSDPPECVNREEDHAQALFPAATNLRTSA
jgi:hypothetical protein